MKIKNENLWSEYRDTGFGVIKNAKIRDGREGISSPSSFEELDFRVESLLELMSNYLEDKNKLKVEWVEPIKKYVIKEKETDIPAPGFEYSLKDTILLFLSKYLGIEEVRQVVMLGDDKDPKDGSITTIDIRYLPNSIIVRNVRPQDWKRTYICLTPKKGEKRFDSSFSETDIRDAFLKILNDRAFYKSPSSNPPFTTKDGVGDSLYSRGLYYNGTPVSFLTYKGGEFLFQCTKNYSLYKGVADFSKDSVVYMTMGEIIREEIRDLITYQPDPRPVIKADDYSDYQMAFDSLNNMEESKKSVELIKNILDEAYKEDSKNDKSISY